MTTGLLESQKAKVIRVASYLPEKTILNKDLQDEHPEWDMERLIKKIGIRARHITAEDEYSSSLAIEAGRKLLASDGLSAELVDYLILVSQSPDFLIPPTSSFVHSALGLSSDCGAIDLLQGCSGFVTALGLAKALIESNQHRNILIITSDTYSKFIHPDDRSVRPIFGDGASATWVSGDRGRRGGSIGHITQGVDGSRAESLIARGTGLRQKVSFYEKNGKPKGNLDSDAYGSLFMDGREILNFTLEISEPVINEVLRHGNLSKTDIKYYVFHQANAFVLSHMREKLRLEVEQVPILMEDFGNTVSGTIPMVLEKILESDELEPGNNLALFGFGVGLAWAGTTLTF